MKVLLAEHDSEWRNFITAALSSCGCEVVSAITAEYAWELLESENAPRLALVNRMMPSISGVELCRRLRHRQDAFYTYFVLLTTSSYRVDILASLEAGADDCLQKPFNKDELLARLEIAKRVLEVDNRLTRITGRWRSLLDSLPFAVAGIDVKGIVRRVNKPFASLFHFTSVKAALGGSICEIFAHIADAQAMLQQIEAAQPFDAVELECKRYGMEPMKLEMWGRRVDGSDEVVYEIAIGPR